jgi:hypothetical protein
VSSQIFVAIVFGDDMEVRMRARWQDVSVKRARLVVYGLDICVRVYLVTTGHVDKAMSG